MRSYKAGDLRRILEPEILSPDMPDSNVLVPSDHVQLSQAISLKRIADSLDKLVESSDAELDIRAMGGR